MKVTMFSIGRVNRLQILTKKDFPYNCCVEAKPI